RATGWTFMLCLAWLVFSALVIYGPPLLLRLRPKWKAAVAALGGASGVATLALGGGSGTGANAEARRGGAATLATRLALALAAPLFIALLIVAASMFTHVALREAMLIRMPQGERFMWVLENTSPWLLIGIAVVLAAAG